MPRDCKHLEPTIRETQNQRAAKLLVYVLENLDITVPESIRRDAEYIYVNRDRNTTDLCDLIRKMTRTQKAKLMYDGRNKNARALADWWDEHKYHDRAQRQRKNKRKKESK